MYSLKKRNQLHYLPCEAKLETQTLTRLCLRCCCGENPKADRETKNISSTVVFVVAGVIVLAPGENVKNQNVRAGFREDVFTEKVICYRSDWPVCIPPWLPSKLPRRQKQTQWRQPRPAWHSVLIRPVTSTMTHVLWFAPAVYHADIHLHAGLARSDCLHLHPSLYILQHLEHLPKRHSAGGNLTVPGPTPVR